MDKKHCPLGGAGLVTEGGMDRSSMRTESVKVVSDQNADFRPGRTDGVQLGTSELKTIGKK